MTCDAALLMSQVNQSSGRLQSELPQRGRAGPKIHSYFIGDQFKVTQWLIHLVAGEYPGALVKRFTLILPILSQQ